MDDVQLQDLLVCGSSFFSFPISFSFSFPYSFSSVFDCLARTTSIWLPPLHTPILRGFFSSCHRRPRNGSWNALV